MGASRTLAGRLAAGYDRVMSTEQQELHFRIGELERKLAYLYRHLNVEEPPLGQGLSPEVQQALMAGNKIEAIRIQREQTGMGLAQAKATVEGAEGAPPHIIE
jgi:hypothetical protein